MTCEQLAAAIAAQTDETKKRALLKEFRDQGCDESLLSGPHTPGPPPPPGG